MLGIIIASIVSQMEAQAEPHNGQCMPFTVNLKEWGKVN